MKKIILMAGLILYQIMYAQVPQKMSYQSAIINSSNEYVVNQSIGLQISILQGSVSGNAIYVETHSPTTNANGLVSIEIGNGNVVSGTFANIDWQNNTYFIKTETDPSGGTNYSITGTSQLLSVPYALHAKSAENVFSGDYNDLTNKPDISDLYPKDYVIIKDNNGTPYTLDIIDGQITLNRADRPTYTVSTIAGNGVSGYVDANGTNAQLNAPRNLAVDHNGNVYFTDFGNKIIRKIDIDGNVTTFAGDGTTGYQDGSATTAKFISPYTIAVDANGNLYVVDSNRIRKIDTAGNVSTVAGSGSSGYTDAQGTNAQFSSLSGITVDDNGNILVLDSNYVRKIDSSGNVTTLATFPFGGHKFLTVDTSGNMFVTSSNLIYKVDASGVITTLAGSTSAGYQDGQNTDARFTTTEGIIIDSEGNIIISDSGNHRLRLIDNTGIVSTIVGEGTRSFEDGDASNAKFNFPYGIAIDSNDNMYVADGNNYRIRKITKIPQLVGQATVNIYFNADGGSIVNTITIPINTTANKPLDPIKTGYTFDNWYKETTLTNVFNFNTEQVASNITLYAKWNINQYTVSFDSNGGSAVSSLVLDYNAPIPEPTPTRADYRLEGWCTDPGLTTFFDFSTERVPASNITLYAKWTKIGVYKEGGIVFYVAPTPTDLDGDGDLDEGLVCAVDDQSTGIPWRNNTNNILIGATDLDLGMGKANTNIILGAYGNLTDHAAGVANAYNGGGYNDWFLPSEKELIEMFKYVSVINSAALDNGGTTFFNSSEYWTSSEHNDARSYAATPVNTFGSVHPKDLQYRVRSIRAY